MKIALLGYGKMGKEIEQIAIQRNHQIVLKTTTLSAAALTPAALKGIDAAIEFSAPASAYTLIQTCFQANIPVVSGTTGWLAQLDEIKTACLMTGNTFFYASNYSIGVNIFFEVNRSLARLMNKYESYEPGLEEIHHQYKKDAPSGTAITLAEDMLAEISRKKNWIEGISAEKSVIQIHSIRQGQVPGTHKVRYESDIDDIEITHTAHNRKGFALGAVLAAEWIPGKKGVFGMNDMLGFDRTRP